MVGTLLMGSAKVRPSSILSSVGLRTRRDSEHSPIRSVGSF